MGQSNTSELSKQAQEQEQAPPIVLKQWNERHSQIVKLLEEINEGRFNMDQTWDGVGSLALVKNKLQDLSDMLHGRGEYE